jgi:hypothetical protein
MGDTGDAISVCASSPEELLVKPLDVVRARPLELLPLCSGIVCRSSFREAAFAAGLADTGGLAGMGGGLLETGFLLMVAPAGIGGVAGKVRDGLCLDEYWRPRTGDSVSSGSVTSATERRLV